MAASKESGDILRRGRAARKFVFEGFDQVKLKPTCSTTEYMYNIEILLVASLAANNKRADRTVRVQSDLFFC